MGGTVWQRCCHREYSRPGERNGTVMRYFLLTRAKATLAQGVVQPAATGRPVTRTGTPQ